MKIGIWEKIKSKEIGANWFAIHSRICTIILVVNHSLYAFPRCSCRDVSSDPLWCWASHFCSSRDARSLLLCISASALRGCIWCNHRPRYLYPSLCDSSRESCTFDWGWTFPTLIFCISREHFCVSRIRPRHTFSTSWRSCYQWADTPDSLYRHICFRLCISALCSRDYSYLYDRTELCLSGGEYIYMVSRWSVLSGSSEKIMVLWLYHEPSECDHTTWCCADAL